MSAIRIGLIEDQPMVIENLTAFFEELPIFELVVSVTSIEAFKEEGATALPIDVLLLDIGLPGISGIEGIPIIKKMLLLG